MAEMFTIDFENYFIFFLISLFSLLCYSLFFKKPSSVSDLPQSPPSLPIIGHVHLLSSPLLHKSFQKISSKYGPLLHLHFFNFPILLVSSASVFHEIYKTQDVNISSRVISAIDESLIFGSYSFITASYGDYWKFMKKLIVTKLLGTQALEQSRSIRADELEIFYRNLLVKAMKNEKIEIRKEAKKLTNNIFCKMIMGRTYSDEKDEAEIVKGLVNEANALTKKIFLAAMLRKPLEKLGISLFKRKVMEVSNRFDELLEKILKEHEEREEGEDESKKMKNMMEVLLEAYKDENAEFKLTRSHIKSFFVVSNY